MTFMNSTDIVPPKHLPHVSRRYDWVSSFLFGGSKSNISTRKTKTSKDRCLDYFTVTNPRDIKMTIYQTRGFALKKSYNWNLFHSQYLYWRDRDNSQVLWVEGDPGKGKTMLLCSIINVRPRN